MMKVGILTFHNAINYGAVLQTYATQEILKQLGCDAEVIDYHNANIDKAYRGFNLKDMPKRNPKHFINYVISCIRLKKRKDAFHDFVTSYLQLSQKRYIQGRDKTINGYDYILIGSDQLWNTEITNGFDEIYWGNFKSQIAKKITWAISMNKMDHDPSEVERIKSYLTNFYAISVRENSLKIWLEKITTKQIEVTIDPTLVLSRASWNNITPKNNIGEYILSFSVEYQDEVYNTARQLAMRTNLKVVYLKAYSDEKYGNNIFQYASPIEFLSLIKCARYVVTGSFHGTAFSIIFRKNFYSVMDNSNPNSRICSLLTTLGLSDRACGFNEINQLNDIDYSKVDTILKEKRQVAISFLKFCLKI